MNMILNIVNILLVLLVILEGRKGYAQS